MVHLTPLYIGGQAIVDGSTYDVISPVSGEIVGQAVNASAEDCKAAVDAAATAFQTWEKSTPAERRAIFLKAADLMETDKYKNMFIEAHELECSTGDVWPTLVWGVASTMLRNAVGLISELKGRTAPSFVPGGRYELIPRALGVILSIVSWNAPLALALRGCMIPIICGNTVVLKTSEHSPRCQAAIFELFHEAGLPDGVLNIISTKREDSPARTAELIEHPAVRKITFTGGERVGGIIATEAAKYLKPCLLELGGKAPVIVLNDADVPTAVRAIAQGALLNSGQVCQSSERVIVQSGVAPVFVEALQGAFKEFEGKVGPLITEASATRVVGLIEDAVSHGAELLVGKLERERATVQPHLVKLPSQKVETLREIMVWQKESFGPVLVLATVDTVDEAVELANASAYSLTSSVWSNDLYLAQDVSRRIWSSLAVINGSTVHPEPLTEVYGLGGGSGYGSFSVDAFTNLRVIVTNARSG